jgi:hypothetical protein
MFPRLYAQAHDIRLNLHRRWLRRQERAALRQLGQDIASDTENDDPELRAILSEIATARQQLGAVAEERAASLAADRADLRQVPHWIRPLVIARGLCGRAVLYHRESAVRRRLMPLHEAAGARAAARDSTAQQPELLEARDKLDRLGLERDERLSGLGGTAHPAWIRRMALESAGLARAFVKQLRSTLLPKAPALAGLAVGWWIANTYTDSHLRSALRSIGIGRGGTHVVSASTYKAMSFWLPLLAAAACAYLGERLAQFYGERTRDPEQDRSSSSSGP